MGRAASGDLLALFRSLSTACRRQFWILCLLMPVTAAAEMLTVAAIVPFLAALDEFGQPTGNLPALLEWLDGAMPVTGLTAAAILFVVAAMLAAALRLALSWLSLRFAAEVGHELNMEIQRRMLHQPYLFHLATHSSRLLASLEKVDELVLSFALRAIQAMSAAIIALAVIAALLLVDVLSAASAIVMVALLYGVATLSVRRRFQVNSDLQASALERRIQLVQENLGGIRDIILDRSQEVHLALFGAVDGRLMRARAEAIFLTSAPRFLIEGIGLGLIALAAMFIAGRPGGLPAALPILGALALGALRLLPLASQMYNGWVVAAASRPIVGEIVTLLSLPMPSDAAASRRISLTKVISLEGVGFHYPDRPQPALRNINLSIPRGSRVAIVGKTGSGKSTLADVLMGMIEPNEGQVRVDGTLLSGAALVAWRQSVAHVPQSIFLADNSIASNIALGAPEEQLDRQRIERAAEIAQLHDFVMSLADGYDTRVGERGARLSGGQRQRLALARAIYKNAPVLVLDEATSALDDATEAAVLASIDRLHGEGRTIVIIAHRLTTVQRCERIFMLDDGELVQSGSFTELFGRLNRLQEQGEL